MHYFYKKRQDFFHPARLIWLGEEDFAKVQEGYKRKPNTAETIAENPNDFLKRLDAAMAEANLSILQLKKDPQLVGQPDTPKKIAVYKECKIHLAKVRSQVELLAKNPQNAELKRQLDFLLYNMAIQLLRPTFADAYKLTIPMESLAPGDVFLHGMLSSLTKKPQELHDTVRSAIILAEPEVIQRVLLNILPFFPADVVKTIMIDLVTYVPAKDLKPFAKHIAPLVAGPLGYLATGFIDGMPEATLRGTAIQYINNSRDPQRLASDIVGKVPAADVKNMLYGFVAGNNPDVMVYLMRNLPPPALLNTVAITALRSSRLQ